MWRTAREATPLASSNSRAWEANRPAGPTSQHELQFSRTGSRIVPDSASETTRRTRAPNDSCSGPRFGCSGWGSCGVRIVRIKISPIAGP